MSDDALKEILARRAIAIKNTGKEPQSAPVITAKGKGYTADRILDLAFADGVKVRQDEDLTNLLDAFEVESPVPLEALHTVGLILQRVYEENDRLRDSGNNRKEHDFKLGPNPSIRDVSPGSGDREE